MLNSMGLGFLFRATDEASPVVKGVATNVTKAAEATQAAQKMMKDVGGVLQKASAASLAAGAGIAGGLGLAVAEAARFQFGIAQVVTEADKAKLPASEIARIAKEMATTYGGDLDTQVKALYQGVAAGADNAAKAIALMNGANRLAIAGNTSQETALLGISKVLNNYGMSFDRATDVADAFFVAVKGGQTTVGELGNAIGEVAALSKNAGLSMEELIGSLGAAATLGRDTAGAAASLKAALSGIAHPTAEAAAEATRLGIKFDSTTLRSMGLVKFLQQISSSSKFSADSMNKLFGSTEAAGFMSALVANKGEALTAMMDGMSKKAGGAEEAFKTMSETLQQQGSILKANVMVALVDLGNAFLPLVTYATRAVSAIVKGFNNLPEPAKKGIAVLAAVAAGLLIVGGVVGGLVAALLTAEVPLIAVAAALGFMVQAAAPMLIVGGALVATVLALRRAFDENVGGLRDTLIPIFRKVELTWRAVVQAFSQGGFSGAVRDELENAGIKNFVVTLFAWASRIQNFFQGIGKGFASASDAAGPTFAKFALAIERLGAALGRLFGGKSDPTSAAQAFDKFGTAGENVGAAIEKIAELVVSGLTYAIDVASAFLETLDEYEPSFLSVWEAVKVLWSSLGPLWDALSKLAGAFGMGGQGASDLGSTMAFLVGVFARVISMGIYLAAGVVGLLTLSFQVLGGTIGAVKDAVVAFFKAIVTHLLGTVQAMAGAADKIAGFFGKETNFAATVGVKGTPGDAVPGAGGATAAATPGIPVGTSTAMTLPGTAAGGVSAPAAAATRAQATAAAEGGAAGAGGPSAEAMGQAMTAAMRAAPPAAGSPVTVPIFLDSEKIGEAMANKSGSNAARSFQPGPAPAG